MLREPRARASVTSIGLIACTFAAIELSGGEMAMHIHLYAVLVVVALYPQWTPLLWAVVIVVLHHGTLGLLNPQRVFGMHHMSVLDGLGQVALHAGLAALEVTGIIILWHFAEQAERENEALAEAAEAQRSATTYAEQQATARAAEAERVRSAETAVRAERLSTDALAIGHQARAALGAALAALAGSVHDIAGRSRDAAGNAAAGVIQAIVAQTGDVASTFGSTASAVAGLYEVQTDIAGAIQDQAAVLAEVTRQLATATTAAEQVLAGLDQLAVPA